LLARPILRQALGEAQATPYEQGLLAGLQARLAKKKPEGAEPRASQRLGVESILSALFLAREGGSTMTAEAKEAFDRMWSVQNREGKAAGSWAWFDLSEDPWEMPDSAYFGAAVAGVAIGYTPAEYRKQPDVRARVKLLAEYLQREQQSQPLHNRLALLWAAAKLPDLLPKDGRKAIIKEVVDRQEADGGWTIQSLGPWKEHSDAPPSVGSNSYATAFSAFVLREAKISRKDPPLAKALDWLRSHQDRASGYWNADSMNKRYAADSMMVQFMRDAATSFAVMALADSR
jgi:squalene-hopene/tetraprenyl-beta-curcumene cyclase